MRTRLLDNATQVEADMQQSYAEMMVLKKEAGNQTN